MAKRRYRFDEDKIQRYIKEGRGQGRGKDYKPWLSIHDFPSMGKVSRCNGWKTNRVQHFMSENETRYFYLVEWPDKVIDIREQYPILDREETMKIAERKGIRYPVDQETRTPLVITTDFLLTINENGRLYDIARTIKQSADLDKSRVIEKFEIERYYWQERGIDWGIVTEQEINKEMASNIEWVHSAYNLEDIDEIDKSSLMKYIPALKDRLFNNGAAIQTILDSMDFEYHMQPGVSLYLFRHLIATKQLFVSNFNEKININRLTCNSLILI